MSSIARWHASRNWGAERAIGSSTVPYAAPIPLALTGVARTAQCLVTVREPVVDQPCIEPLAITSVPAAEKLLTMRFAVTVDVVDRRSFGCTTACATGAVMPEYLFPQRGPEPAHLA